MIYMFLAPGFEEVEALFPLDLLRRADLAVKTVAIGDKRTVVGSHGIPVTADITELEWYSDPDAAAPDAVILPGGMPGTTHLAHDRAVEKALAAANANGGWIAAICAAPMVLGKQGYLRGRRATCFPGFEKYLDGATEIGGSVIRDGSPAHGGGVITARGVGVAMEFGLELVSVLASPEEAGAIHAAIQAQRAQ